MPQKHQRVEKFTGGWLRVVSNAVSKSFGNRLREHKITIAEFALLRILLHSNEALSPGDLGRSTGLSKGSVSKLLDRAVRNGIVLRTESETDRRYQEVRLTNKGKGLLLELEKVGQRQDDEFFSCLTNSERESLVRILKKISTHREILDMPTD